MTSGDAPLDLLRRRDNKHPCGGRRLCSIIETEPA